jgi:hypothetical protein
MCVAGGASECATAGKLFECLPTKDQIVSVLLVLLDECTS